VLLWCMFVCNWVVEGGSPIDVPGMKLYTILRLWVFMCLC